MYLCILINPHIYIAQSAGAVECTTTSQQRGKTSHQPGYDIKQSNGEALVMLELWGMQSTPSLPSLPCPLLLGVVEPDRVLSMSQTDLNCVITLNWIVWN